MKYLTLTLFLAFFILSCGKGKKIEINDYPSGPEDTFLIDSNPTQSPDSIIIFNSRDTVTPAGDSIYIIITKFDKRMIDQVSERNKNNPNPVPYNLLGNIYRLQKKSFLKITAYDTLGYELKKIFNKELPPGEYKVATSVYSTLKYGWYYIEIIYDDKKQLRRLAVSGS